MKVGIHPDYKETTITCVCGNVIETKSTKKDIKIDICSNCHPVYHRQTKNSRYGGTCGKIQKEIRA